LKPLEKYKYSYIYSFLKAYIQKSKCKLLLSWTRWILSFTFRFRYISGLVGQFYSYSPGGETNAL